LNTQVVRVNELEDGDWLVVVKDWSALVKEGSRRALDAVVVATRWYDNPVWPDSESLDEARAKGPATCAKEYRGPTGYEGKV
jgi:hypothetical protein